MEKADYKLAVANIRAELRSYINKYKLKSLISGESGGIDSALCTVLAIPVCKELNVELIGRSITIETNKRDEIERGASIGRLFCTNFKAVDLSTNYESMRNAIEEDVEEDEMQKKIRRGNIKARMRMVYLYNLAQRNKGIVLSTDNYTEYLEGFWTLHGDVGDYGMIQSLWKTEVYEMSQWLVDNELKTTEEKESLDACIKAVPTDGLGISNSDLDQLGVASYFEVDKILQEYLAHGGNENNPVVQRHINSGYKRNNPFNLSREQVFTIKEYKNA